jgi:uncharacterized protein YjbI with pentapeptide repeats
VSNDNPPAETSSRVTVLTPRAIVIGGAVLAIIAAGAVWLLLAVGVGTDQLDAIRTGGTLVVGAGGAVALLLAARRQRSTELELQQKYEAAHDARIDATERRITELYIKAADQLGSDKAPIRLAGLYALERLGQDTPHLRQTIVNVICAYLRMPYALPAITTSRPLGRRRKIQSDWPVLRPDPADTARQEREVRLTAQGVLRAHLRRGPDPDNPVEEFWAGMSLDFTEATLIDFDLSGCVVSEARFSGALFAGDTDFSAATFVGHTRFDDARFVGDADFALASFAGATMFHHTTFTRAAVFEGAGFTGSTRFDHTTFTGPTVFAVAKFTGDTTFSGAGFAGSAWFDYAEFTGVVWFSGTEFVGLARFHNAKFWGDAWFGRWGTAWLVKFGLPPHEHEHMLGLEPWARTFTDATFADGATFAVARFAGAAGFSHGQLTWDGTFADATFEHGVPAEVTHLSAEADRPDA